MESNKFGREFYISVIDLKTKDKITKTIGLPLTTKFQINRTWGTSAGSATIQIYNLNKDTRAFLRKDLNDVGGRQLLSFTAGYGTEVSTIFEGIVQHGYSTRQGVDFITTLTVSDMTNAWRNATFSNTFKEGTSATTIIMTIAKGLEQYGIKVGKISRQFSNKSKRGTSLTGKSIDLLNELTGGQFMVDNGVLNVITDDEYLYEDVLLVNSKYGLIGKPRRESQNVVITMLLEPKARVAQRAIIKLENDNDDFNGTYYIRSVSHAGTISAAIGESATTELYLTPFKFGKRLE